LRKSAILLRKNEDSQFRGMTFSASSRVEFVGKCWKNSVATGRGGRISHTSRGCARIVVAQSACRRLYATMNEIQTPNEGFLNKEQLAEKLRCHPRTVENLMADGKIPYIKLGRKLVRFDWEKVKARLNQ
jgi:excisionase family DNA binding protein